MRHYYFIVTGYNVEQYIEQCIDSILGQDFDKDRFEVVVVFDGCTDNGASKVILNYRGLTSIVENNVNCGAAFSRSTTIETVGDVFKIQDNDVIITVDADDYLAHDQVLNRLEEEYSNGADVTYGNLATISHPNIPILKSGFTDEQLKEKKFRSYGWKSSQLRTFKYGLYKNLHEDNFKDADGNWLMNCTDLALMFPILEQAEKPVFIEDILYIYRNNTGNNTRDRFSLENKTKVNKYLRRMKTKYK